MPPRPPRSTRTDTLFPYTTLFRSRAMRPTRITRLVMGFLLIEHSGSIPAANPSRSAPRRSAPKGNSELGRVVRAAGHSPATRPDLIRVARLDWGDSGTGLY